LAEPANDELRTKRRIELAECNIFPIWYPRYEDNESIEAFLSLLVDGELKL
jgi:hypothetical protein